MKTSRRPAKTSRASRRLAGERYVAHAFQANAVSPHSPTVSIEQAIAEEIDDAVDGLMASDTAVQRYAAPNAAQVPSHGAQVLLPRPGSPAHAGIWPAPERVRPLTVRFADRLGHRAAVAHRRRVSVASGPLSRPSSGPRCPVRRCPSRIRRPSLPTVRAERRMPVALRYVLWMAVLFGVGFAAALGIGAL